MKCIRTHAWISSPPNEVWTVLADFRRYSEWNPLNLWADGDASLGARVPMRFVDAGGGKGKVIAQTVTVTECDPPHRLAWVGHIPLLFKGRHFFELTTGGSGTHLIHGEDLSGLIPALFSEARIDRQRGAYEAMNSALSDRVEKLARDVTIGPAECCHEDFTK